MERNQERKFNQVCNLIKFVCIIILVVCAVTVFPPKTIPGVIVAMAASFMLVPRRIIKKLFEEGE